LILFTTEEMPFQPKPVSELEDTGLSHGLVLDLILKYAYFEGTLTLEQLARRSKLSHTIIYSMYRHMQKEQLCDTRAMVGNDYEISLSIKGRGMAEVALKKSQYSGPAPVSLNDYNRTVAAQAVQVDITAESLKAALGDLVLSNEVIHEVGTALVTGGALLLYGSTGNGKTSIAERLQRIFHDLIYIPHAVEVAGQIVTVFDPIIHRTVNEDGDSADPRWLLCRRPMLKVGGEMRADMLDTRMDEVTRVCAAPLQMKANNGILLIDDFGRQRITPRELLNRWIVPLDRGKDILSLWSGVSFEIPFEVLVIFATNLSLSDLAEDAFLRRLRNKIKIDPLTPELFRNLLRRVCQDRKLTCSQESLDYICSEFVKQSPDGLRACFPGDLIKIICGIAAFEKRQPSLEKKDIDHALRVYFVH
jgi:energy-coupling factor transporter ATP-binding protein EcfA2